MANTFETPPTQGPSRGVPDTSGRLAGSSRRSRSSEAGDKASPSMSRTTPERSRILPSRSSRPGFSWPTGPWRRSFMRTSSRGLKRKAAVDEVDRAGGEGRFVGGEIDRQRRDLFRRAETAHRLALDKAAPRRLGAAGQQHTLHRDALFERGGGHRARADRVAADALGDE